VSGTSPATAVCAFVWDERVGLACEPASHRSAGEGAVREKNRVFTINLDIIGPLCDQDAGFMAADSASYRNRESNGMVAPTRPCGEM